MEAFIVAGVLASLLVAALIGAVCVRYTRIFFGILALALSQVLWSLAYKLFWVTGGSDGLRVPTPTLLGGIITDTLGASRGQDGIPRVPVLLLRAGRLRRRDRGHVGDRPLAVRQGAPGHP